VAGNFSTMLSKSEEGEHTCLIPIN
jgi:hypothetical protein